MAYNKKYQAANQSDCQHFTIKQFFWRNFGFENRKLQCSSLTRAELGPGSSPLVSGVIDSLKFKSSENSCVTGVDGCCGVKMEEGPG